MSNVVANVVTGKQHQHTVVVLFVAILFLRVYKAGKIQLVWQALNGTLTTAPAKQPAKQPANKAGAIAS
jgi:hypothetical protein